VEELYFTANVDNYGNQGNGSATYQMRYLIDWSNFDPSNGTILFYAGNEGDVWTFYNNTGFMTVTLAQQLSGLVVFGEHRYFGTSAPFGDASYDKENLVFLTVEQAMFDFVLLVQDIRYQIQEKYATNKDYPCIAFGGSYGGMLAAWLRMKYPGTFQGALASSAPILFFEGSVSPYAYNEVATQSFASYNEECPNVIRNGFAALIANED
jgi:pimeloyl-ACP methyl ester carboxylesterase